EAWAKLQARVGRRWCVQRGSAITLAFGHHEDRTPTSHECPPAGGSHGKLHRTTTIPSYAARRRGRSVAAVTRAQQPAMPVNWIHEWYLARSYCAVVKSAFL